MSFAWRKLMRRFVAVYAIAAVCFISLYDAHIHRSETHTTGERHQHDMEVHVAHASTHHDNIIDSGDHLTDASFVELEQVGSLGYGIDDLTSLFLAFFLLLFVVPPLSVSYSLRLRERVFRIDVPPGTRPGARGPP